MKKLLLPVMFLSALALSGGTVPAVATAPAQEVTVAETSIVADAGAVLTADTVLVETEPAPVAVEPVVEVVEPVAVVEPAAVVPVATEPAVDATEPVPSEPVVEPAPEDSESSYPAPPVTGECLEDQPCWDCATMGNEICGNPVCEERYLFTVDKAGTCSSAPIGWTVEQVRADALFEFNSRNADASPEIVEMFERSYAGSAALGVRVYRYIQSSTIPGVVHAFK